ncbi:MAG TPA: Gfo/Idh/MocA family oxidoreductase [Acidimicrobiales bacterium]|nr:Gfo/Idh/MocA family oxidoreductase [Acidimicrobiales bacterium]
MPEPTIRGVGVVGLGIGTAHVRALRRLRDRYQVVAVCDPDPSRADPVAERIGAEVLLFEQLLGRDDVEIVHLCTPPGLHLEQCRAALAAGKHVVCEKPLVASLADVDTLEAAAAGSPGQLMPVFQYRFGNGLQKVKTLVDAGVAGTAYTHSAEVAWRRRADYYAAPWRGLWTTEFGGVLLSQAIHAIDMLTYIAGPAARVFCRLTTRVNSIEVEDCAAASIELSDGSLATLTATLGSPEEVTRHRYHFAGFSAESGTAPYASSADPWTITPDTPEAAATIAATLDGWVDHAEEWQGQFARFADALDSGSEPPVTLADARASIELLTAMYASARSGEDVTLPIGSDHPFYGGWLP